MKRMFIIAGIVAVCTTAVSMEKIQIAPSLLNNVEQETLYNFIKKNIEPYEIFMALRRLDKHWHTNALKTISTLACAQKKLDEKNELLSMVATALVYPKNTQKLLMAATVLVYAGANANTIDPMGYSLLHRALCMEEPILIKTLLEHKADCTAKHYITGPIFYDTQTISSLQLLLDKKIDVNTLNDHHHTVLWHLIDAKFSPELLRFYLKRGVHADYICQWDGACVLHAFAEKNDIKNEQEETDFLKKVFVILKKQGDLVNRYDKANRTPITLAEETIRCYEKDPARVKSLHKFIDVLRKFGGKSTKELQTLHDGNKIKL